MTNPHLTGSDESDHPDLRDTVNTLIEEYTALAIAYNNPFDVVAHVIHDSQLGRPELAALLAFVIRRLWNARTDPVAYSHN